MDQINLSDDIIATDSINISIKNNNINILHTHYTQSDLN